MREVVVVRRWVLFVWAAALPIHRIPLSTPVPRAGAGEWIFPLAVLAAAPWLWRARLRGALALPLIVVAGLGPTVAFALDVRSSTMQLGVLLYVAALLAIARQVTLAGHGHVLLAGYVSGGVVSCVWGWAAPQHDAWLAAGWPRPVGPTESPNMLAIQACTAGLAALVARSHASEPKRRAAWLAIAIALLTTALATLGHVIFAALVAATFALVRVTRGPRGARCYSAASVAALASAVVLLLVSARVRLVPLSSVMPFVDARPNLYAAAHTVDLEVFVSSPLVGVGLECFGKAWPVHDDGVRFAPNFAGGQEHLIGVPIDTHSTWLGYLAEAGLLGGLVMLSLVLLALHARRRAPSLELEVVLVFTAATAVFADVLTSRELALVIGVLGARSRRDEPAFQA